MVNLYHILFKKPSTDPSEIAVVYEELSQLLYSSGLVRIDADNERNFVKYFDSTINNSLFYSKLELTDPVLIHQTKKNITNIYSKFFQKNILIQKVSDIFLKLESLLKLNSDITKEKQLCLIRLLVQSTHPIVIRWILIDRVQIFISYGQSIGDIMDIKNWKISGQNSGMQSTNGKDVAIYVSCGGDPFQKEFHSEYGDGMPAIARLQIIAAQELGHYSDIIRDNNGRQIGRHSANFSCNRAKENVLVARRNDLKNCAKIKLQLLDLGLDELIKIDNTCKFYTNNNIKAIRVIISHIKQYFFKSSFIKQSSKFGFIFIQLYKREKYLGLMINSIINDMCFNLAPIADVYKKDDKEEEEAIACIEALARIPQQAIKWGHITTKTFMKDLYKIYYKQVIPDLISKYEIFTHTKFINNFSKPKKSLLMKIKNFFIRLF